MLPTGLFKKKTKKQLKSMACEHSIKDYQPSLSVMFENNKKQRAEVKIQNLKVISTIHT